LRAGKSVLAEDSFRDSGNFCGAHFSLSTLRSSTDLRPHSFFTSLLAHRQVSQASDN